MTKSIPYGLLAFAVSSSLLFAQGDKPAGGWSAKPGSGLSYDGGDAFGLKWGNRLQIHYTFSNNEDAADISTFNIRRARTMLSGHVFNRNITYNFVLEGVDAGSSGDGAVRYAWAQWNFSKNDDGEIGLRAGQSKSPFGLEAQGTSGGLWFVERASAARAFSDGFTRGAWIHGRTMGKEMPVRFVVGAQNTDPASGAGAGLTDRGEETSNSDNELSYVFGANIDPLGDFYNGKQQVGSAQGDWRTDNKDLKGTIGVGVLLGNGRDGSTANGGNNTGEDVETTSINLNTAWNVNKVSILGEYFMRTDDLQGATTDEEESSGFAVSLGYLLDKSGDSAIQWGFGIRYSFVETDAGDTAAVNYLTGAQGIGNADGEASEISLVANAFYHGHSCKTQLEWTLQDVEPTGSSGVTNHIFRVGFQLEF